MGVMPGMPGMPMHMPGQLGMPMHMPGAPLAAVPEGDERPDFNFNQRPGGKRKARNDDPLAGNDDDDSDDDEADDPSRLLGRLKGYNAVKGFGFISMLATGSDADWKHPVFGVADVFLHRSEMLKLQALCGGHSIPPNSLLSFKVQYVDTRTQQVVDFDPERDGGHD